MSSIKDDRGYNQGFSPTKAMGIRTNRRCQAIIEEMDFENKKEVNVLEIGCGTGELSYLLAKKTKAKVFGSDLCFPFIEDARKNYSLPNLKYEVLDFNFPEQISDLKFDYIVGNGILHHLYHHLDDALKNINFLLQKGGKIIFWEPNIKNPYCYLIFTFPKFRKLAHLEPDEMAFSRKFITKKLKNAGYRNIKVEYRDFLLPVIPDMLIQPTIVLGNFSEKIPGLNWLTQSLFICASK